ncbi:diacylglycerol/lipid kinase family protein [Ferviditalea candida]|uniref:Diacylglycerol kinase family protein n=1 Tax=Ferviditalea candida TaxID=3108399 RepID=A0ABU5ZK72_9BACL|nr:diacylglycerol kinase family protein [Paenibacillaceae bacterium T2]
MYLFIVNTMSGNGKGMKVWKRIESMLQKRQVHYLVEFSASPTHTAELVRQTAKKHKIKVLAVVGGDGTVQSMIHSVIGRNIPLGIIPAGSGNDLARGLKIPLNPKEALHYLLTGGTGKIDIIQIGNQYCMTVVGIGIDAKVAQTVNRSRYKKWFNRLKLGHLAYVLSFIQVLTHYRPVKATIKVDGKEWTFPKTWLIAVANFPNYGGGMIICPGACYFDGEFHICIVDGLSRWELLRIFPAVYRGKHIYRSGVTLLKGKTIEVISDSPMPAHGDGEIMGETPMKIDILEKGLSVICHD